MCQIIATRRANAMLVESLLKVLSADEETVVGMQRSALKVSMELSRRNTDSREAQLTQDDHSPGQGL